MTVNENSNNEHQLDTHHGIDINMSYMNVRSVNNKTTYLLIILQQIVNIFAICETWFNCTATNSTYINALLPSGYSMHHIDRSKQ